MSLVGYLIGKENPPFCTNRIHKIKSSVTIELSIFEKTSTYLKVILFAPTGLNFYCMFS